MRLHADHPFPVLAPRNDRVAEVGAILAAGLMRAVARKSSQISAQIGESSLDFTATESGHPTQSGSEKVG